MSASDHSAFVDANVVVSSERLRGTAKRWRRHGEPHVATSAEDPEARGVFGPGSVAWDVLLHPAVIVFQSPAQFILQLSYKPVVAGVRDWDPISKKAHKGELTLFDVFDRGQRNSGIHAPMWLGDTDTAKRVSGKTRRNSGLTPGKEKRVLAARVALMPLVWLLQKPPIERYFQQMMWGPDAVELVAQARKRHKEAKRKSFSPRAGSMRRPNEIIRLVLHAPISTVAPDADSESQR